LSGGKAHWKEKILNSKEEGGKSKKRDLWQKKKTKESSRSPRIGREDKSTGEIGYAEKRRETKTGKKKTSHPEVRKKKKSV